MKKTTKITNKAYPFNPDGDHDIMSNLDTERLKEEEYDALFDDPEYFFMQIHKGNIYCVNKLKFRGKRITLLEPNPVTFYFSIANDTVMQIDDAYQQLENSIYQPTTSWPIAVSYSYIFRVSAIFIIFAYTACDAFLNQQLPEYGTIEFEGKQLSKKEIEWLPFEQKLKVVNLLTGKYFAIVHPHKMKRLLKLKELRNSLIHLKEKKQGIATSYNDIYQTILDLNLKKLLNTVKFFINFYKPQLIVNNINTRTKK